MVSVMDLRSYKSSEMLEMHDSWDKMRLVENLAHAGGQLQESIAGSSDVLGIYPTVNWFD